MCALESATVFRRVCLCLFVVVQVCHGMCASQCARGVMCVCAWCVCRGVMCVCVVCGHHSGHRTLALRDCYDWWALNGEVAHAGKPLVIDPDDALVHHIFFDDNVNVRCDWPWTCRVLERV